MALVLCTGISSTLMETRRLILQQAGHTVITALGEQQVESACAVHLFEVAVIGQAGPAEMRRSLASRIRHACPSAKILELYPPYQGRSVDDADDWLEVPAAVPEELVQRVSELAGADPEE
jgi:hypothetical protein